MTLADLGGALSWRRLGVLIRQLPADSRLARIQRPELAWSATEYLLAHVFDALAAANWQRGADKSAPRPKPIPRPGVTPDDDDQEHFGTAIPLDQLERRLHPDRFGADGQRKDGDDGWQ